MTLSNSIQTLVISERHTIVAPPVRSGQFQGWGTKIG